MVRLLTKKQQFAVATMSPSGFYSRPFGLSCKATAGLGNTDFAYGPSIGNTFWLRHMSIHYMGGLPADLCGGTIIVSCGVGVPTIATVVNDWEFLIPWWAGTTKPSMLVLGTDQFMVFPMNRLFTREALRFGLYINNGSDTRPFYVDAFFEISEG